MQLSSNTNDGKSKVVFKMNLSVRPQASSHIVISLNETCEE